MGVTNYLTVDGEVRSEHRTGDTHTRDYVLDALGSVVEVFQGTSVVADASYKPYGAMVSGSWNMASYKFRWAGSLGYRYTGLDWVTAYVRARHYSYNDGAWTTVDPLWPRQKAYQYVNGRVTVAVDPSGKWCRKTILNKGAFEGEPKDFKDLIRNGLIDLSSDPNFTAYTDCIGADCRPGYASDLTHNDMGNTIQEWAANAGEDCKADFQVERDTGGPKSLCDSKTCAWTDFTKRPPLIHICRRAHQHKQCGDMKCILAHELIHAQGHLHGETEITRSNGIKAPYECVKLLSGCENFTAQHSGSGKAGMKKG